jgi:hypothetical protein
MIDGLVRSGVVYRRSAGVLKSSRVFHHKWQALLLA